MYKIRKTSFYIFLAIYPYKWAFLFSDNFRNYLKLLIPSLVYIVLITFSTFRFFEELILILSFYDTSSHGLFFFDSFMLLLLYLPIFYFVFSTQVSEKLLITKKELSIRKFLLNRQFFSITVLLKDVKKIELAHLHEMPSSRSTSHSTLFSSKDCVTACRISTEGEKNHIFGFWLTLHEQESIISEIKNFLGENFN